MGEIFEFPNQAVVANTQEAKIPKIRIHPEFRDLLKPLSDEEYKTLEQSIVTEGCKHPIEIWNSYIVDGHNRHDICLRQGVDFKVVHREFASEDHVKLWILVNQFSRRNLTEGQKIDNISKIREILEKIAKENSRANLSKIEGFDEIKEIFTDCWEPNSRQEAQKEKQDRWNENRVNTKLAKIANVSPDKVFKYEAIKKLGTAEDILEVKEGKKKINPTYEELKLKHRAEEAKQEFPREKYRVIYADLYKRNPSDDLLGWEMVRPSKELHNIPVKEFLDNQAIAFLWTPINFLTETLNLMKSWGFKYETMFVGKTDLPFKDCYNSCENYLLLVGAKNGCLPDVKMKVSSNITQYTGHFERNNDAKTMIEMLYPNGNKIEFFSDYQNSIEGWDFYKEKQA